MYTKLIDLPRDGDLLRSTPYGVYIIFQQDLRHKSSEPVPYYVGSGWIVDRLFDHLHKWAVGLHTVWMLEDDPGLGLSRYDTLGGHTPYWFPVEGLHPSKGEQSEILTWLCDRLHYSFCPVEKQQAQLLEGELIDRLKGRYRLANATGAAREARNELGSRFDLSPYRDCLAKGHSMWNFISEE